jgi:hypothetical protein
LILAAYSIASSARKSSPVGKFDLERLGGLEVYLELGRQLNG